MRWRGKVARFGKVLDDLLLPVGTPRKASIHEVVAGKALRDSEARAANSRHSHKEVHVLKPFELRIKSTDLKPVFSGY
jgi:hypothetical protein